MRTRPILLLAAALLAACGGDSTGSSGPVAVQAVSGSGQPATVGLLAANPLVVRVTRQGGGAAEGVTVQWAVAPGGGSVTAASTVTGADGQAQVQWMLGTRAEAQTVTATVQGLAPATFTITPAAGPFARVSLSPDSVDFSAVNQRVTLLATYTDAYGNGRERPGPIAWTSLDEAVARIESGNGPNEIQVVARAGGRARIRVLTGGRGDTAIVRVRQQPASIVVTVRGGSFLTEGDTTRALAEVRDLGGSLIPNAPLTWSTTDTGATIDATGKITALRGDTLDVVAAWGHVTGTAPLYVAGLFRVASVDAGGHHSCALTAARQAYCWGWNGAGELGVAASGTASAVPVAVQTGARFADIAVSAWPDPQGTQAGRGHTCGITTDAALLCWGEGGQGQLGRTGTAASHVPAAVAGGGTWVAVSTGGRHTCGITTAGQTYCWGLDGQGQVGAPTTETCVPGTGSGTAVPCASAPARVSGGLAFTRISAGTAHTCALTAAGEAYCWGRNDSGQLGNGTTVDADAPVAVLGGHTYRAIHAGGTHTCANAISGAVYCWGNNSSYQVGHVDMTRVTSPVYGAGSHSGSGWAYNCGLSASGEAYCSGANDQGQGGKTPSGPSWLSTGISGGFTFTSLSTGGVHTCGVRAADRAVLCWGDNDGGKLGAGLGPDRSLPRPVRAP